MSSIARFDAAVAAVMVVAVVALVVKPSFGVDDGLPASTSPSPTAEAARSSPPSIAPAPTAAPTLEGLEIDPGPYVIRWPNSAISPDTATSVAGIRLTVPPGWLSTSDGTTITRYPLDDGPTLSLSVHDVTHVIADACSDDFADEGFVPVGPTVEELVAALANQPGPQRSGPTEVILGGYPAKRFALTLPGSCPGGEGRMVWANGLPLAWAQGIPMNGFGLLKGGGATVHVVDVNGERLVLTTQHRGASDEAIAELEAIIASIEIVKGPSFSFDWVGSGWEWNGDISLNKSIHGPQGAEAIIYWTGFPNGAHADSCGALSELSSDASTADLAAAVAGAPGTELVAGPSDVMVGGHAAKHVVLTVREDRGCDPGYFYDWSAMDEGVMWLTTDVGDTIRVWIVDVGGTPLFIAGETHAEVRPGEALTEAERAELERKIEEIVDSIRFE